MRTKTNLRMAAMGAACFIMLFISACQKDARQNPSPALPTQGKPVSDAIGVAGPKAICYMEVNNADFRDVGEYKLTTGQQLFDIGIIFAANINYNTTTQKAVLYYNTQVANVLNNKATYIQPIQNKGIKVLLSILGNHEGAGISNFPTQAAADDFATLLSNAVTTYGLDGIDFDDEYADYGTNGTGQPNAYSFVYLVTKLRALMPTKIISFYFIGPASTSLSYNGVTVGSKINYSWNPYYGTYSAPVVPGLTKSQLGPAAIDIQNTSSSTAVSLATQTVNNSYGVYLFYNLPDTDQHTYLSGISHVLYNQNTTFTHF
jgi:hypothetical protein